MASNKSVTYLFNYGSSVAVRPDAPDQYKSIEKGSICGIRVIDSKRSAISADEPIGTLMYLVEDCSGKACEIPEQYLRALED
jgi:hypothetical protein